MSANANPTLRPRTRRLISIEDDTTDYEPAVGPIQPSPSTTQSSLQAAVSSAFSSSRSHSPIPAKHPSRASASARGSPQSTVRSSSRSFGLEIPTKSRNKSPSLWQSSWAGLQDVASTLLGNNIPDASTPLTPGGTARKGAGAGAGGKAHRRNYSLSVPDEPWGPGGSRDGPMTIDTLAVGSHEERLARVQAEKRKKLLAGLGEEVLDANGRYKRRSSVERRDSLPSPTAVDDALVYVHKVGPSDSVAGLSVRYNCSQAVVRKTNRLWANDSIQVRKVAYLPVDACAIRGVKIEAPVSRDLELLAGAEDVSRGPAGDGDYQIANNEPAQSMDGGNHIQEEQPWTHDSWVRISSTPDPVEIGRMPRRMLGWFPPPRRKSNGYSDNSPPRSVTSEAVPSNATSALTASNLSASGRTASPGRLSRASRTNSSASRLNPNLASILRGSGGVGSLHSNVRGPAPDELNKFVATHLPLLSIQDADSPTASRNHNHSHNHSRSATSVPLRPGPSGPRMSFDRVSTLSTTDSVTSVEAMAGAVEGWLRKAGGKVKGSLGTPEMRGRGRAGTGAAEGDLIELTDSWELNANSPARTPRGGDNWESVGHGVLDRAGAAVVAARRGLSPGPGASVVGARGQAGAREEEERLLRERFPPVGKVFEAGGKR